MKNKDNKTLHNFEEIIDNLELKNNDLSCFNKLIARDLKEHLNTISKTSKMIEKKIMNLRMSHKSPRTVDELLSMNRFIQENSKELNGMVKKSLDYSISGGPLHSQRLHFLEDLILESAEPFLRGFNNRKLKLELDLLCPLAKGDRFALSQILSNLFSNSYKFCSPKRKPTVKISTRIENKWCIIRYEDNGIGLKEGLILQNKEPKKGIGLSIIAKYVKASKGSIKAECIKAKGTLFTIKLLTEDLGI